MAPRSPSSSTIPSSRWSAAAAPARKSTAICRAPPPNTSRRSTRAGPCWRSPSEAAGNPAYSGGGGRRVTPGRVVPPAGHEILSAMSTILGEEIITVLSEIQNPSGDVRIGGAQKVLTCPGKDTTPINLPRSCAYTPDSKLPPCRDYKDKDIGPVDVRLSLLRIGDTRTGAGGHQYHAGIGAASHAEIPAEANGVRGVELRARPVRGGGFSLPPVHLRLHRQSLEARVRRARPPERRRGDDRADEIVRRNRYEANST